MRQGDGADLLGPNDPRNSSIGIIYVAPTDDRQSVLRAILTQDNMNRKHIVIVLPDNNRAFQRPIDFDGLKSMRRGLKAEIVFIASAGPGPGEYARQRRFQVYSTEESFASSLGARPQAQDEPKKGWFFGRKPRQASVDAGAQPTTDERERREPVAIPLPMVIPSAPPVNPAAPSVGDDTGKVDEDTTSPTAPLIGAAAAGVGAAAALSALDAEDEMLPPPPTNTSAAVTSTTPPTAPTSSDDVDDTDIKTNATSDAARGATPGIIAFPTPANRPRTTAKLPVAPTPDPASGRTPTPARNVNTGKRAAVAAGAVGAAGVGLGAAMLSSRAPTSGGAPPIGAAPARPGGGGGGGGPRRSTRRLLILLLLVLTLLLVAGIAFASPAGQQVISNITGSSTSAVVTITPKSKLVSDNFVMTGVTGTPDPAKRQVSARVLTYSSPQQSQSANATGSIPGKQATGALVFINTGGSGVTISGGILTGADGVKVSFGGPLFVPIGSTTTTGMALNPGTAGNIRALDIYGSCCGGLLVRNPSAFSGGQNAVPNTVIQQSDIDGATTALVNALKPGAQKGIDGQVRPGEQALPSTLSCKPNVTADHRAGDIANSVTVKGSVTCTEEVYDAKAATALATSLLQTEAKTDPGTHYALVGSVIAGVTQATPIDAHNTVSLLVHAEGVWVYQFSEAEKTLLKNAIANKKKSDAQTYLQLQPGVSSVSIAFNGDVLPGADQITIVIKSVPGASGSPTVTTGSPTVVPGTPTAAPTSTNGLGSSGK